ncbi:MAG TPA: hypothetical protein PKG48_01950 [Bacteroidales bacterium]|nr:hypothetical protein [Bacteroidales bacterium]HPS62386.1 hypothetical protein [Bacteroidales bacterium]
MNRIHRTRILLPAILLFVAMAVPVLQSCKKEPGPGGNSTLFGKVLVKDYNSTFTVLQETYYGPGIWVYLVYGDNRDYGERIQTGYDGTWEFKYLRPGNYKVYAFSKDSTLQTNADVPVIREVNIPGKKQDIEVPDLVIFN